MLWACTEKVAMKVVDWRTGQHLKVGDIADWGPAPKSMIWCSKVEGKMVADPNLGMVGHLSPDYNSCRRVPYPESDHQPGYQLLAVREESLTRGQAKLRMLKSNIVLWWPLSIRFLTKHGLRVGYIID